MKENVAWYDSLEWHGLGQWGSLDRVKAHDLKRPLSSSSPVAGGVVVGILLEERAAAHTVFLVLIADRRFAVGAAIHQAPFAAPGAELELTHPSALGRSAYKSAFRAKKHNSFLLRAI